LGRLGITGLNIKREIRSKRREKREVTTLKLRNSETLNL
jgi:hypothetical protein